MAKIQCKMCGGELLLPEGVNSGTCEYCGCLVTFPRISSDQLEQLYNRAEHFRRINDYDNAVAMYEKVVNANPDDPEAYWGLVLSRFGIEYVEDPVSHERIPTCHRVQFESIMADADYLAALERADYAEKEIYEREALRIAEIQKGILAISNQEEPFDVFICYKESDDFGKRTRDSVLAQEIYYALTQEGLKVFFARITLEKKLGQQYEPYIFAALNSAKAMLVIGTKPEYFNAVWVRNEWSRYLALMKRDRQKLLIPCYRDMDAYDIPDELSMFQAQDMSKIGFIQDIIHGVKKIAKKSAAPAAAAAPAPGGKDNPLLRRAQLFVETGDFASAREFCEKVLNTEPENGLAYYCRMLAELQISDEKELEEIDFTANKSYKLALRFAGDELKSKLNAFIEARLEAERKARLEAERKARLEAERKAEEEQKRIQVSEVIRKKIKERMCELQRHLDVEKKLHKRQNIIQMLERSLKKENRLCQSVDLLTDEAVAPVKEYSEQAMFSAGDLAAKEKLYRHKQDKKLLLTIGAAAAVVCLMFFIISYLVSGPLKRGDALKAQMRKLLKFSSDGKTVSGVVHEGVTHIEIPEGVTCIGNRAFSNCTKLQSVTIPNGVTRIGDEAFSNCTKLQSVTIPNGVTCIGNRAFSNCTKLQSVTIPNGVTRIENHTFNGCTNLQSVTIPGSVTRIDFMAFYGCSKLQSVTIPDSVTRIGNMAFSNCTKLQSVTIPKSVTYIENGTFDGCTNLQSVTIPNGVTHICGDAFRGCSNLQSVTIPKSVTRIWDWAFDGCTNLTVVSVPRYCKIGDKAFPKGCKVVRR